MIPASPSGLQPHHLSIPPKAAPNVQNNKNAGRRLAQATCTAASGATGNETAYNVVPMTGGNGTLCFNVTVSSACDATKDCCPAGATEMPRFDSLILEPPSNSSCASKGLRRCIK